MIRRRPFTGFLLASCIAGVESGTAAQDIAPPIQEPAMRMILGTKHFAVTPTDNEAARAFAALLPLALDMSDMHSNEKYADLPQALPTDARKPGTIHAGDMMLFGDRTVVVFYKTFDSSWSYTPLGRVDDPDNLAGVLGSGSVRIEFTQE